MPDVYINFEREQVDGIVAVDTCLADAVKRFGIRFAGDCDHGHGVHHCALIVSSGISNLSPPTKTETEHFAAHGRRSNERLACEARIIKSGEIVIMTNQKKEEPKKAETPKDRFQAEFEAMPLDKKFASLFRMEAATLTEAFEYVVKSPMKVVEKFGDVITEFGIKLEKEARKATRPAEKYSPPKTPNPKAAKSKSRPARKPAPPSAPKA